MAAWNAVTVPSGKNSIADLTSSKIPSEAFKLNYPKLYINITPTGLIETCMGLLLYSIFIITYPRPQLCLIPYELPQGVDFLAH
jgi:hypothetical protein